MSKYADLVRLLQWSLVRNGFKSVSRLWCYQWLPVQVKTTHCSHCKDLSWWWLRWWFHSEQKRSQTLWRWGNVCVCVFAVAVFRWPGWSMVCTHTHSCSLSCLLMSFPVSIPTLYELPRIFRFAVNSPVAALSQWTN